MKACDIVQMNIQEIKRSIPGISIESVLKINKGITKAGERDLKSVADIYTKVSRENELQPVENFFKIDSVKPESVDESILSALGDGFKENYAKLKSSLLRMKKL